MKMKWSLIFCVCLLLPVAAPGQETGAKGAAGGEADTSSTEALQKATQNPVASLISVPFQDNINGGISPGGRVQNVLNIQPVIPVGLSDNWNLITRAILPIVYQPYVGTPNSGKNGLGDLNPTFFLSPAKPGKLIWGFGPSFLISTATNKALGSGKWAAGPSLVVLTQTGHWTIGALVNNIWSFAGQQDRAAVNSFLLQYFLNYNLKKGWYLTSQPIITSNWRAEPGDRWTVPVGGGFGRIFRLGKQPLNGQLSAYYNAVHPDTIPYPKWQLRVQLALLYPKRRG
jgi:hypothetical protein